MDSNRRIAVVTGAAFLIATIAQVAGAALVSPILGAPDLLTDISANEDRVILGAVFQFIGALACTGIAAALYPALRGHGHGLAIGSVGFRTIEGGLHALIAVCWLMLVSVSQDAATAGISGRSSYEVAGAVLAGAPDWLAPLALLAFGLGALCYYWVFYQSRLIPRWLSAWGLVAIVMVMASALLVLFRVIETFSTPQLLLAAPIGLQEMVLAVWLIAKGFNPSPNAARPAGRTSMPRATAAEPAA